MTPPLPSIEGGFRAIVADPPWHFATRSEKGRGRCPKYATMSLDDIKAMPVARIAAKDCLLVMWVIGSHVPHALTVMDDWGFTYSTLGPIWGKTTKDGKKLRFGGGYWWRQCGEIAFVGTRGNPKRLDAGICQLVLEPRREHSRKPDSIYTDIERLVAGPYLELFARTKRPGWECWGDETDRFTI